ncbi:hypothetical protein D3C76_1808500 [compost metagenome]
MKAFTEKRIMPLVNRLHNEIREDVNKDPYMKWPMDVFAGEPERIRAYVAERREYLTERIHQL